jgi:hypothetical protein
MTEIPQQSPTAVQRPDRVRVRRAIGCSPEAVLVLVCLCVHGYLFTSGKLFEELQLVVAIVATGLGFGCSISSIRKNGWANRGIATLGLIWFGLLLLWVLVVEVVR